MTDYNKIYKELKRQYSDEEIADFAMIPEQLSEEEAKKAREDFVKFRMQKLKEMSDQDRLLSNLLSIKYQIKSYVDSKEYESSKNFGHFLIRYIELGDRNQKEFAEDINIHPSRLNRILKGKERIGKKLAYRLEQHSGEIIPAIFWWKLMQKEVEEEILSEKEARELEKRNVKNVIYRA